MTLAITEHRLTRFFVRLLIGAIFICSGWGKLMAHAATVAYIHKAGVPAPELAYWNAITVELVIGAAFVAGYHIRACALVLAAFTFAAALLFHGNIADHGQAIHFMKNLAICGGLLQFLVAPVAARQ